MGFTKADLPKKYIKKDGKISKAGVKLLAKWNRQGHKSSPKASSRKSSPSSLGINLIKLKTPKKPRAPRRGKATMQKVKEEKAARKQERAAKKAAKASLKKARAAALMIKRAEKEAKVASIARRKNLRKAIKQAKLVKKAAKKAAQCAKKKQQVAAAKARAAKACGK